MRHSISHSTSHSKSKCPGLAPVFHERDSEDMHAKQFAPSTPRLSALYMAFG
jgi:hypothetical protein